MSEELMTAAATPEPKKRRRLKYREYRELVEPKAVRVLRRINSWLFALLLGALIAAICLVGWYFLNYCRESFDLYENAQLSRFLEQTVRQLNDADAAALSELLTSETPEAEFDDGSAMKLRKYEVLAAAELTAKETRKGENGAHRYNLYADGKPVGTFEIASAGQTTRLGLLVMEDWQYAGGSVSFGYDRMSRTYTVPEGFTVTVNGKPLSNDYLTGEPVPIDTYSFAAAYEDMPEMVTYSVSDLMEAPGVRILDNNGSPVEFDPAAEKVVLPDRWNPTEVPEERAEMIMDMALLWTEYALFDRTLNKVKTILIPDSRLWIQAEKTYGDRIYRENHTITGYEDQKITEYTVYSENCFSCRVSMLRHIYVNSIKRDMPDTVDDVLFFYRTDITDNRMEDPQWYLIDAFSVAH